MIALTAPAAAGPTPPIRVTLSETTYAPGDRGRVYVRTAEDGYLVVLQVDADGRVRVLFPVDPDDDAGIKGGHKYEVRSRGDRDAFTVTARSGSGLVLAARTDRPFDFSAFVARGRWDLRSLAAEDSAGTAPDDRLLDIVERMTSAHYDYDDISYDVGAPAYYQSYPVYYYGWRGGWGGWGGWGGGWYPGFYAPWSYYGPSIRYRPSIRLRPQVPYRRPTRPLRAGRVH
jgi:hypothetical protein